MKTRLQILAALIGVFAFSGSAMAWDLHFNTGSKKTDKLDVVTPSDNSNSILTNARVMGDGTVISNSSNNAGTENIDNVSSIMSYHHGSSSGGDGIKGKNIISLSVGFVSISGLLTSAYTTEGYSASSIPPITLSYLRGLSERVGFGVQIAYTSYTLKLDNQTGDPFYNNGIPYTYSDKLTISGIGFGLVGTYDFVTDGKVLPYLMYGFGYEVFSANWTTTDPNSPADGNINSGSISGGLPWFNIAVGSRFFFTDNFGAYAEFGWHGLVGGIIEVGLTVKL